MKISVQQAEKLRNIYIYSHCYAEFIFIILSRAVKASQIILKTKLNHTLSSMLTTLERNISPPPSSAFEFSDCYWIFKSNFLHIVYSYIVVYCRLYSRVIDPNIYISKKAASPSLANGCCTFQRWFYDSVSCYCYCLTEGVT